MGGSESAMRAPAYEDDSRLSRCREESLVAVKVGVVMAETIQGFQRFVKSENHLNFVYRALPEETMKW